MAEADAEGREQDGAQELQAPAAARAQAHLGSDPRALLLLACFANSGKGNGWLFLPFELKELELPVARRGTGISPASWGGQRMIVFTLLPPDMYVIQQFLGYSLRSKL
jgi:hypothetical protein